jgi:SARP family transcriptional regulator, regulator of embCAB operon
VIRPHVLADLLDHLLIALGARDEAALTGVLGHPTSFLRPDACGYLGVGLATAKVQLCGKLVLELDGERLEGRLPGRQGRLLFAFLVVNRNRTLARATLIEALWPEGKDGGLAPLLSKLRRVVPLDDLRIVLPPTARVDIEAAADAVHRAESALAQEAFHRAWGPSQVAMFVAARPFLPGEDAPWIEDTRRRLSDLHLRALEAYARAGLGIGGTELPAAVRTGHHLIRLEPYRETGYRLLMYALVREGNPAEALRVYDQLRQRLHDDLGVAPSSEVQILHRQLLR